MTTRLHVASAVFLFALGGTSSAIAWSGEPLCAIDAGPLDLSLAPEPPVLMCRQDRPSPRRTLDARRAANQVEARTEAGANRTAILALDVLAAAEPALADWIAVERGDLLLDAGDAEAALAAYQAGLESDDSALRVRSRVGRVLALLAAGHRGGADEVRDLRRLYPDLPEEQLLELALGAYYEARGEDDDAARVYRSLDVRTPGSSWGALARERLEAMSARGVAVRDISPIERLARVENLFARGPLDAARVELTDLEENPPAQPTLRTKAYLLMAKLARHEGRWNDARRFYGLAGRGAPVGDAEDAERLEERADYVAHAASARDVEEAERRLDSMERGRISRIGTARLVHMLEVAARAGLAERANAYVDVLAERSLPPRVRLDVALEAMGTADDAKVLPLLEGLSERAGELGVAGRYHEARLLARVGRFTLAEAAFLEVIERDRSETRWYAMWAEQQLGATRLQMVAACGPEAQCTAPANRAAAVVEAPRREGLSDDGPLTALPAAPDTLALAERLAPLVEAHGEAYPWLGRAAAFLRIDRPDDAGTQLYEAFLAYREATGRPIRRAGLESVALGRDRRRRPTSFAVRRARRALDAEERETLASIGDSLGAVGVSTGFGGWDAVRERPRAYAAQVHAAAAAHGLDPNLLFAVMRVESVYQKDIVSYAGAIGLAQIMPRTGTLIARERGKADFTCADLLDPGTNLEFAAWYLRSLIDRFDGHLPLAIASYNGGPHNVRRWIEEHGQALPMDAFLEHIPFTQTHRYVRRVLGHYQAYRAQQGLPMIALSTTVPSPDPDPVGF